MSWLLLTVVFLGGAVFFALRAATQGRLQVEAVLGRMAGYGYGVAPGGADPRAWLRRIGRVAPGGRGEAAEALRRKLAAAGWSKRLVPEDVAGLKIVLPAAAYAAMFVAAAFALIPVLVAAVTGVAFSALAYMGLPAVIDMRVRGRRDKIVSGLPTVLDLLTLSIEAGMSFDAALSRLARRLDGPEPPRLSVEEGLERAGWTAVHRMTEQRGASNAHARECLGWEPERPSWRAELEGSAG